MDDNAPRSESCRLQTRHWKIKYDDGKEETVNGRGVVGTNEKVRDPSIKLSVLKRTHVWTPFNV